jgi:hypothetical protein
MSSDACVGEREAVGGDVLASQRLRTCGVVTISEVEGGRCRRGNGRQLLQFISIKEAHDEEREGAG